MKKKLVVVFFLVFANVGVHVTVFLLINAIVTAQLQTSHGIQETQHSIGQQNTTKMVKFDHKYYNMI